MIILLSGAILGVLLCFIPMIWNYCVPIISGWCKKEPNRDSKFRLLKDANGDIYIQFSNNRGKTYYNLYDIPYSNEEAKNELNETITRLNQTEKIIYEYDPHRLRITDGSEKEFQEEDDI